MKTQALAIAVALALCVSACAAAPSPLIGEWSLDAGADCPIDHLTFTAHSLATHVRKIGPFPANETTEAVSYAFEAPNKAIVQGEGTGAGAAIYLMTDHDHMASGETPGCKYVRSK